LYVTYNEAQKFSIYELLIYRPQDNEHNNFFSVLTIPNLLAKLLTFKLLYRRTKQIKKESGLSRSPCYLSVVYPFQSVNHMAAFYETWYEHYVTEDTPTVYI